MADSKVTALSAVSVPDLADILYWVDVSDTADSPDGSSRQCTLSRSFGLISLSQGRLTLTSGVPVTISDVTGASSIKFTPYFGNLISVYDGTRWKAYAFTEKSLSLTATSGSYYDVFIYDNSGTLTLELSAAWSNSTTRTDALALQDGVFVKSSNHTRRWLGYFKASGTNTTEDSAANRYLVNAQNATSRELLNGPSVDSMIGEFKGVARPPMAGTYGSRPSAGTLGQVYYTTNSIYTFRDNGTSWDAWIGELPVIMPSVSDLASAGVLSANINNSVTSMSVNASPGLTAPFIIQIGTELLRVTATSGGGGTFTISRGYAGTSAASHTAGDAVSFLSWNWFNQGTGVLDTTLGGIILSHGSNGTAQSWRMRCKPVSGAHTLIAAFRPFHAFNVYSFAGVGWRESSSGKLETYFQGPSSTSDYNVGWANWTNATTFSAYAIGSAVGVNQGPTYWVKLYDDGTTNRYAFSSMDGINWFQLFSKSRTNFLTPDEVFFGVDPYSQNAGMWLVSWSLS